MYDMKPADISDIRRGNIWKTKSMSLQQTVRTRTSETCIKEYMNLIRTTNQEITLVKDENGDLLPYSPQYCK
jgi:hypothetical protein